MDMEMATQPLASIYEQLEQELMRSIARRIKAHQEITGTIQWEVRMLAETGRLSEENRRTLARVLSGGNQQLAELLESVMQRTLDETEPQFQAAAEGGMLQKAVPPRFSDRLQTVYHSYLSQAADVLNLTNTTMLASAEQAYRDIIAKTVAGVITGQKTRTEALKETVREFARQGLPALIDKAGRKWSPEGYTNMVLRSTANNVARETRFARMDDWGSDLFYISAHSGARPRCAPYQGLLVSKSGKNGVTEDIDGNKVRFIPISDTSYGEKAGIFGINCGHYPLIFIPGVSGLYRLPTEEMQAKNEQDYQQSQQQSALERQIRKIKSEIDLYDASGIADLLPDAADRLQKANATMALFLRKTGRTRRRDREQIY